MIKLNNIKKCIIAAMVTLLFTLLALHLSLSSRQNIKDTHTPPWIYGKPDAQFTIIEYADLECPGCKVAYSQLKTFIQQNPDVNWQWHHYPLTQHEPVASQKATLIECAGLIGGNDAFWQSIEWLYQKNPADAVPPFLSKQADDLRRCLSENQVSSIVLAQFNEAEQDGVILTPTLKLKHNLSGKTLMVQGMADANSLLSGLDWLLEPEHTP